MLEDVGVDESGSAAAPGIGVDGNNSGVGAGVDVVDPGVDVVPVAGAGPDAGAGARTGDEIGAAVSGEVGAVVVPPPVFTAAVIAASLGATLAVVHATGFNLLSGLPTENVPEPFAETPATRMFGGSTLAG
ncbi:MAG: hypothetical protein ABI556_14740 [Gemmatimonadales bacterium]